MSLKRINETSEKAILVERNVIFPESIFLDEDVLFECSCVCLGDVIIQGSLSAQYDLRILGKVVADNIHIGGRFDCASDVESRALETGKSCTVSGNVNVKKIIIGGSLICDELGCEELTAKDQVVIRNTADVMGDIQTTRSIICLEGITADGNVDAEYIVAGEYADVDGKVFVLSELDDEKEKALTVNSTVQSSLPSIADASIETLKDYSSPLATVLDDVATFVENCQEAFSGEDYDNEMEILKALSSFLPSFSTLYEHAKSIQHIVENPTITEWYSNFLLLSDAFLAFPDWMRSSEICNHTNTMLKCYLHAFSKSTYALKSRSIWGMCIDAMLRLKANPYIDKPIGDSLDNCISLLYNKIGIKSRLVKMYLPEA